MGPMSFDTLTTKLFEALSDIEDFSYSTQELRDYYDTVKPDKKNNKKQMKTSAYKMFLSENAGKLDKPNWKDIKDDPDQFQIYATLATKKNEELGFSPDQNPQEAKKLKTKNKNLALKAAIAAEKQKKIPITPTLIPNDTISQIEHISPPDSPISNSESPTPFDKIDINADGVISREEYDTFIENTSIPENTSIQEESIPVDNSTLPLFEGKAPKTPLNNFKQWVLKQKNLEFNSKISRDDMTTFKEEYNFDKDKYDEQCQWFEFIQNNMRID
jgi:hypothetical protein